MLCKYHRYEFPIVFHYVIHKQSALQWPCYYYYYYVFLLSLVIFSLVLIVLSQW
jgi:hypothetical protein